MALSGRAPVIRQFPLIPGIDFAGTVKHSSYPGITAGDRVVANGWGLSQTHHAGYAQQARPAVSGSLRCVRCPQNPENILPGVCIQAQCFC